jgi:hypothetical protein
MQQPKQTIEIQDRSRHQFKESKIDFIGSNYKGPSHNFTWVFMERLSTDHILGPSGTPIGFSLAPLILHVSVTIEMWQKYIWNTWLDVWSSSKGLISRDRLPASMTFGDWKIGQKHWAQISVDGVILSHPRCNIGQLGMMDRQWSRSREVVSHGWQEWGTTEKVACAKEAPTPKCTLEWIPAPSPVGVHFKHGNPLVPLEQSSCASSCRMRSCWHQSSLLVWSPN